MPRPCSERGGGGPLGVAARERRHPAARADGMPAWGNHLADAKAGPRKVPLTAPVASVLANIAREPGNPWVFVGQTPGARLSGLRNYWHPIRARAGLDDVRLLDLRHSFASRALALGESLPMIGKLLGHSQVETTARYAHLARDTVHESAPSR